MDAIRYIKRKDIDTQKWDACIDSASNGLIYAYSFYLDAMCDNWDALVLDDYKAVMPLPWRKKWGFKYVYRPAFTQQLGVFGSSHLLTDSNIFLQKVAQYFSFGEYFVNYNNTPQPQKHCNLILSLNQDYNLIFKKYKTDLKNNLKKAYKNDLRFQTSTNYQKAINLYRQLYAPKIMSLSNIDLEKFEGACLILQQNNMLLVREATNQQGELMATALCLKDNRRIYFIASSTLEKGRNLSANHFLLDRLIHEFSEQDLILDFEGSDLSGVKHFYQNFGAIEQPYFFYRWNKLPWPIKLLKHRS